MSITSVTITSQTNANINGIPTLITNWTYPLDMSIIDAAGVQIFNNTSPNAQILINFTNISNYNTNQIIIKSNNIRIDGGNQTLNLSDTLSYNGLIKTTGGCSDIEINNIDIKVNSNSTLNGYNIGWVCQGNMHNTTVTFTNCKVHSDDSINIINNSNGGICGGLNGFGTYINTTSIGKLKFVVCSLIANNGNINIDNNSIGGICGGNNVVSTSGGSTTNLELDFDTCIVTANNGNININGDESGIICGGENGYNNGYTGYNSSLGICYISVILKFSNCNVEASSILINNSSTGGICGGSNGSSNNYNLKGDLYFIFTNCIVFSNENNITINGNSSGGIFGGYNGVYNNGSVVLELTFIDCNLESSSGIIIDTTKNGGICGGNNEITVSFINCILYYSNLITFEGQNISSVTFFYLINVPEPLYIIGITNTNTLHLDNLSRISSSNPSGLAYSNSSTFTVGHPTETIIPSIVNKGIYPLTYSINPALPAWITLDINTGIITVSPTTFLTNTNYTVTATYNTTAFIVSNAFNIKIDDVPPSGLSYSSPINIFTVNTLITSINPLFNGPPPTGILTYTITPAIPGGLNLNINTGIITGTPLNQQAAVIYTVTVTNDSGSKTAKIRIEIKDVVPIGLSYPYANLEFIVNKVIQPIIPILNNQATVTGTLTYSIQPPIPIGLKFNNITGAITGTPLPQQASTPYTITVSNSSGNATTVLYIEIKDIAPAGLLYPPKLEFIVNKKINKIILPIIANQSTVTGTLIYSIDPTIPIGLKLNNNTGEITGTPIKEQAANVYTIKVSNLGGFAIYNTIIEIINLCSHMPPDPPNLWSRESSSCVNYDQEKIAMRRKAEILKHKGNQKPLTKNQKWSNIVNGNSPLGKKVWARQNDLGSNPNLFNLPQVGNTLILCPNKDYTYYAYVTNKNDNNISGYIINQSTGELNSIGTFPAGNNPQSITVAPNGKFAYVANNGSNNISGYTINQTTGELASIGTVTSSNYPSSVLVDPSGKFVYVANQDGGNVSGYEINQITGILTPIGTFPAEDFMRSVSVDPSGKFVYVTNSSYIYNNVSGYTINTITGDLTEIIGSPFSSGNVPWSVVATKKFAYVANQNDNTVSGYTIDQTTGALIQFLVPPFTSGSGPSSVTIDPTERFVYVANIGNGLINSNVSGYIIDQATGALTQMTDSPFPAGIGPASVSVVFSGKFAYVANNNSNNVSGYRIHQTTGNLIPIGTFSAGRYPTSVTTVRILSSNIICQPSAASDVPGNSILCYDPSVPLVNYINPRRTYLAGGTKWPQTSWKAGANGFPRGKKGSMNMLFQ